MRRRSIQSALPIALIFGSALPAMANLTITPTFDSSITSNPNSAQIQATINQAIGTFQLAFTDPINVKIRFFDVTSGLGGSGASILHVGYQDLRNHMVADASSADDSAALAGLPNQANDPVTNSALGVDITTAQARALGYSTNPTFDCDIFLNSSLCHFNHGSPSTKYDYFTVASHEIIEALGSGGWGSNIGFESNVAMLDLFRYDEFGARTFTTSGAHHAYFSLNGTTRIDEFNQFNYIAGDYGDWQVHQNPQIQDWAGTTGPGSDLVSSEFRALDVVGYNRAPVPEPRSIAALGLGLLALIRLRGRRVHQR